MNYARNVMSKSNTINIITTPIHESLKKQNFTCNLDRIRWCLSVMIDLLEFGAYKSVFTDSIKYSGLALYNMITVLIQVNCQALLESFLLMSLQE
jgi:hypothetical protein